MLRRVVRPEGLGLPAGGLDVYKRQLQSEGVSIPQAGRIAVLSPFMERNGFYDGDGWWIAQAIPSAPGTGDAQSAADHHTPLRSPK